MAERRNDNEINIPKINIIKILYYIKNYNN